MSLKYTAFVEIGINTVFFGLVTALFSGPNSVTRTVTNFVAVTFYAPRSGSTSEKSSYP